MPHPTDIRLEITDKENKFFKGQIVSRYGVKYKITRIVPEMNGKYRTGRYLVFGIALREQ